MEKNIHEFKWKKIYQVMVGDKVILQGSHASGKCHGKMKFCKSQGNVREF